MKHHTEWIKRAKSDYLFLNKQIEEGQYYEDYCYHAQQTAEKALKGLLIYYGTEPEFTHDIGVLIKRLKNHVEIPDYIRESVELSKYASKTRYPGDYYNVPEDEYKRAVDIAKKCLDWVESKMYSV